jgi:hypothetical protein
MMAVCSVQHPSGGGSYKWIPYTGLSRAVDVDPSDMRLIACLRGIDFYGTSGFEEDPQFEWEKQQTRGVLNPQLPRLFTLPTEILELICSYVVTPRNHGRRVVRPPGTSRSLAESRSQTHSSVIKGPAGAELSILYAHPVLHRVAASCFYRKLVVSLDGKIYSNVFDMALRVKNEIRRLHVRPNRPFYISCMENIWPRNFFPPKISEIWYDHGTMEHSLDDGELKEAIEFFQGRVPRECRLFLRHEDGEVFGHNIGPNRTDIDLVGSKAGTTRRTGNGSFRC